MAVPRAHKHPHWHGPRLARWVMAVLAMLVAPTVVVPAPATAQPTLGITQTDDISAIWKQIHVYSPAMSRTVRLDVLLPANPSGPRPTLYLLDGNGANDSQAHSSWLIRTDAAQFFSDKNVNVVLPVGGGGTFYTDWIKDDPTLGRNKWETFLTNELPTLINTTFEGNGTNAIAGVSMGAQAATTLMFRNPNLYQGLAAYSGCMYSSNLGQATVRSVVIARGGNPNNMWGAATNPQWPAHDPFRHATKLKGKAVYIYTGGGAPGPLDANFNPSFSYPVTLAAAAALEGVINGCTVAFDARLRLAGVKAKVKYTPLATHSWPYWQVALRDSWPTLRTGLGL